MYLPKSQYKQDQTGDSPVTDAKGNAVKAANFIKTAFGLALSVPSLKDLANGDFSKSEPLKVVGPTLESLLNFNDLASKKDTVFYPEPQEVDYTKGILIRYFAQDKRDKRIIEVDKQGYVRAKTRPTFKRVAVNWVIKGPADDYIFGEYMYPGAESQNKNIVEQAEEKIPGLKDYIKDYKQFVK